MTGPKLISLTSSLSELCHIANKAAINAGVLIQSQFEQEIEVRSKKDGTSRANRVVTTIDKKAQEIILNHLEESIQQFDLGILTEELPDNKSRFTKPYFWSIDPLDGTLPFVEGSTGYAVSIALVSKAGDPIIGVVYRPDTKDCYTAIKNSGLLLNGKPFTRPTTFEKPLRDLLVVADESQFQQVAFRNILKKLGIKQQQKNTVNQNKMLVGMGAVCNALEVLNQQNACYFKLPKSESGGGSIWDFSATRLLFEEAGLFVSNILGEPLLLNNPNSSLMNKKGVIYTTSSACQQAIINLAVKRT